MIPLDRRLPADDSLSHPRFSILPTEVLMSEQNKESVRRSYAALTEGIRVGNLDRLGEFVSENIQDHNPDPGQAQGLQGVKEWFLEMGRGFPDMQIHVDDLIAEGDRVVGRVRFSGTHSGDFQGIPGTLRQISVDVIDIFRIEGEKIVERWGLSDQVAFMQQMGISA